MGSASVVASLQLPRLLPADRRNALDMKHYSCIYDDFLYNVLIIAKKMRGKF